MAASRIRFGSTAFVPILALALGLSACTALRSPSDQAQAPETSAAKETSSQASPAAAAPEEEQVSAQTPVVRSYRKAGARHLYKVYAKRIYKGKLPPLIYAVVVVETDIDAQGRVTRVRFGRTPPQAPEVPGQIALLIERASPLPDPGKVGPHTYIETWLWDKSGRFQLDSLSVGQRAR